jgi:hypothetical protein
MEAIETKIKHGLADKGIKCQSVYRIPDPEDPRLLLSFSSQESQKITTMRIQRALNSLGVGEFDVPKEFQRLSAAFLHLEVSIGARTEKKVTPRAT